MGNVLATVSDQTMQVQSGSDLAKVGYFLADVVTANDYLVGGMQMPGRKYQAGSSSYQYGFAGKRKDNDIYGEGNAYDFDARMHSPRVGRWFSTDPNSKAFSSPYNYVQNNPVNRIDPDGKDDIHFYFVTNTASKTYGIGVSQRTVTYVTHSSFVYIEKNAGPDRFYNHRVSNGKDKTKEFYPFDFNSRGGITESYAPFSFNLISRSDRDVHTLAKYYDASPAFKNYLDARLKDPRVKGTQNGNDYKNNFFPERANFNFWSTVSSTAETAANLMMLAGGSLSIMSEASASSKLTALGSSQGEWGALKNAGKLGDFNILKANVDPAIFKTAIGRESFWQDFNKPFLDKVIGKGGKFKLFDEPNSDLIFPNKDPSLGLNFFGREIEYLKAKGYVREGNFLIPGKK